MKYSKGLFWDAFYLLIVGAGLIYSSYARAEIKVLNLDSVFVDTQKYVSGAVLPWIPQTSVPNYSLDLHINLDLINKVAFLNSMVHSMTDDTQFRVVGLQFRGGVHLGTRVDVFYEHYSQHLLDVAPAGSNVYDTVGVRLYLYREQSESKGRK